MKQPNPNCELCDGLGVISMDDSMKGYSFSNVTCECVKENDSEETF